MEKLHFREFNTVDFTRCAELSRDTWTPAPRLTPLNLEKLSRSDIELTCRVSTWMEIAAISGNTVGCLFGRINRDYRMRAKIAAFFTIPVIGIDIIRGKYGPFANPFTFIWKYIVSSIKMMRAMPKADGEVLLFTVDAAYRGRGIGRTLMNRFLEAARGRQAKVITLGTTEDNDWQFYEKYGYRRHRTFVEDLSSYLKGEMVEGFVYTIDLG